MPTKVLDFSYQWVAPRLIIGKPERFTRPHFAESGLNTNSPSA